MSKNNNQFKTNFASALTSYVKNSRMMGNMYGNGDVNQGPNNKWEDFARTGIRRKEALINNSVSHGLMHPGENNIPPSAIGGRYNPFANVLYATLDASKANRIYEYRLMATYPEVSDALEEISNSFITLDENQNCIKLNYRDKKASIECQEVLEDEFEYFINFFDLIDKGKKYCKSFLVDGEVFLELIINNDLPENTKKGILGVMALQTELVDVVYKDKYNGIVAAFIGKSITFDPSNPQQILKVEPIAYQANQLCYVCSQNLDPTGEFYVPFIERARKRYIQLSYIEDAIVIYRLVRAPERLIFTVDTGNMPAPRAEQYLTSLRDNYWKSKTFDVNTGDIMQKFEPQSMLDAYWMAKGEGNEGVKITQLAGGQNLDQLADLNYFIKALYRALVVPASRLNPDKQVTTDPSQTLQEELKFAEFIVGIQRIFANAIKQSFITHLKLKGLYKEYNIRENLLDLTFNAPSNYFRMRELQKIQLEGSALSSFGIDGNMCFSRTWALKRIFNMSDSDIISNIEFRKIEAAHDWEYRQISEGGPNWKQLQLAQMGGGEEGGSGGDMGDIGGMGMGGMGGMGNDIEENLPPDEDIDNEPTNIDEENPGGGMEEL